MLDERLRESLHSIASRGGLDTDAVFDDVQAVHGRHVQRRRIARQAGALVVVLTLFVGVGIFVSWRATPERYRSAATVQVGAPAGSAVRALGAKLTDPVALALAPATRRATLLAAHLAPDDQRVRFRAARAGAATLSLDATAPTASESTRVTRYWVSAFAGARREDARRAIRAARSALNRKVTEFHRELVKIDSQLAKLDPADYHDLLRYDAPNGNVRGRAGRNAPPTVPERGTPQLFNLAFARIQLLKALADNAEGAASLGITAPDPGVSTKLVMQSPAARVDATPAATVPALAVWLVGTGVVLAGATLVYRRRTHPARPR